MQHTLHNLCHPFRWAACHRSVHRRAASPREIELNPARLHRHGALISRRNDAGSVQACEDSDFPLEVVHDDLIHMPGARCGQDICSKAQCTRTSVWSTRAVIYTQLHTTVLVVTAKPERTTPTIQDGHNDAEQQVITACIMLCSCLLYTSPSPRDS